MEGRGNQNGDSYQDRLGDHLLHRALLRSLPKTNIYFKLRQYSPAISLFHGGVVKDFWTLSALNKIQAFAVQSILDRLFVLGKGKVEL